MGKKNGNARRPERLRISVGVDVDAEVEGVVIPIGVMFAAPVAFAVEAIDVVVDLRAARAEAGGVAIDAFFGVAKALVALVAPIAIGARGAAKRKRESEGERNREDESQRVLRCRFHHWHSSLDHGNTIEAGEPIG